MPEEQNKDIGKVVNKEIPIRKKQNESKIRVMYIEGERITNVPISLISDEIHDDESYKNAVDAIEQKVKGKYNPDFP